MHNKKIKKVFFLSFYCAKLMMGSLPETFYEIKVWRFKIKMWNSFLFVFAFVLKLRGNQPNLPHNEGDML